VKRKEKKEEKKENTNRRDERNSIRYDGMKRKSYACNRPW
jgi:hypothetical protein